MDEATEVIDNPASEVVAEKQPAAESPYQFDEEKNQLDNEVRGIFSEAKDGEDIDEVREALSKVQESLKSVEGDTVSTTVKKGEFLYHGTRYDFEEMPKDNLKEPDHVTHAFGVFYSRRSDVANYFAEAYSRDDLEGEYGEGGKVYPVVSKEDLKLFNLAGKMNQEVDEKLKAGIISLDPTGESLKHFRRTIDRTSKDKQYGHAYLEAMDTVARIYLPADYKHDYRRFVTDVLIQAGFDGIDAEGNWKPEYAYQEGGSGDGIQIFDEHKVETQWDKQSAK